MKCTIAFVVWVLLCSANARAHNEVPGAPQKQPVALVGATIHPVSGPSIEKGTLVFAKGKITALGGADIVIPEDAEKIDLAGKHVYPALFDALTDLGLVEINSIRATIDGREVGDINPNVRAVTAVNPDSELIPVTRSNGVLLAVAAPYGGLLAGRSAVIQLDGWTWEDMALGPDAALHIEWPAPERRRPEGDEDEERHESREKRLQTIRDAFDDAKAYAAARTANPAFPRDARWESLQDVMAGKIPVVIYADDARQITAAAAFAEEYKLKLVITGGYDAPRCADLLKQRGIAVIVGGVYRLPLRRADAYDAPYALPAALHAAGIRFCIASQGRFGASNVRNLPYHAATAVGFGLPAEEGLKSITLYPAQILGVADRVGSLEAGKDATLFVADGDPLDTPTQVERAWIQGRRVELNDRHKRLYHKYQQKYEQIREGEAQEGQAPEGKAREGKAREGKAREGEARESEAPAELR